MQTQMLLAQAAGGGPFDKAEVTVTTNKATNASGDDNRGIFMTPDKVGIVWAPGGGNSDRITLFDPTDFTSVTTHQRYNIGSFQIAPIQAAVADNDNIYTYGRNNGGPIVVWSMGLDATTINWATEIDLPGAENYQGARNNNIAVDNDYVWVVTTETATRSKEIVVVTQLNKSDGTHNWTKEFYMTAGGTSYNVTGIDVDYNGNLFFCSEYRTRGIKCLDSDGNITWEYYLGGTGIAPDAYNGLAVLDGFLYVSFVDNQDLYIVKMDASDGSIDSATRIEVESGINANDYSSMGSNGLMSRNDSEIIVMVARDNVTLNRWYTLFIDPTDLSVIHNSRLESSVGNPVNGAIACEATGNGGVVITAQSNNNYCGILNTDGEGGGTGFTNVTTGTTSSQTIVANAVSGMANGSLSPTITSRTVVNVTQTNPTMRDWVGI